MLHQILLLIAIGTGGGGGDGATRATAMPAQENGTSALVAEDQTPTGRFLTATEVRPILAATRANWVALRDYQGQDLLYVTHLLAWRCGLARIEYAVNDAPWQVWTMPPCYVDTAQPNAITGEDSQPYIALPRGSVETVRIRLTYDDLGIEEADFARQAIMMP